jgi:DNA invertase Pin-like site-specific DNA recombinase
MSTENRTNGYLLGYCRVSTADQNEELQVDALTSAGCDRIFTDNASGKLEHRPALDAMLEVLRPGDTVVAWRLDRLARSVRHLLELVALFEGRGVGLRSLREAIDTTTPTGRLTLHLFASIAEFERDLLVERTQAGLAAARARGRKGGRPTVMTPEKIAVASAMHASGEHTVASIARVVNASRATVYRALAVNYADDQATG